MHVKTDSRSVSVYPSHDVAEAGLVQQKESLLAVIMKGREMHGPVLWCETSREGVIMQRPPSSETHRAISEIIDMMCGEQATI